MQHRAADRDVDLVGGRDPVVGHRVGVLHLPPPLVPGHPRSGAPRVLGSRSPRGRPRCRAPGRRSRITTVSGRRRGRPPRVMRRARCAAAAGSRRGARAGTRAQKSAAITSTNTIHSGDVHRVPQPLSMMRASGAGGLERRVRAVELQPRSSRLLRRRSGSEPTAPVWPSRWTAPGSGPACRRSGRCATSLAQQPAHRAHVRHQLPDLVVAEPAARTTASRWDGPRRSSRRCSRARCRRSTASSISGGPMPPPPWKWQPAQLYQRCRAACPRDTA